MARPITSSTDPNATMYQLIQTLDRLKAATKGGEKLKELIVKCIEERIPDLVMDGKSFEIVYKREFQHKYPLNQFK